MWSRRVTTLTILTTAVTAAAAFVATPSAVAERAGDPIYGDFNMDMIRDRVVLGAINPNLCSMIVEYGAGQGVFVPPIAFVYQAPGVTTGTNCPDIGTAFDADNDQTDELYVAWSNGPPPGVTYNRLIIDQNFTTLLTYQAAQINAPTVVGSADFTGTGRALPFVIGPGGYSTAILVEGLPVVGPQQWCSVDAPAFVHARFDNDAAIDTLLSYRRACGDNSSGVVVLFDDGTVRRLEHDPAGESRWRVTTAYLSPDQLLDVRAENLGTGRVEYYYSTGLGDFVRGPKANTDRVTLPRSRPIAIDVLANDWTASETEVIVTTPPRYGRVQVLSDRRILYSPNPTHGRTDRFTYALLREGRRSSAVVYLTFPAAP
ncbi:Ig-like domain-containing protein [Plantactinospora sonchi]|uniref:Ig-like domain-containing protein n=1 Tax=Plantactinospora sonchi TaxID=1544735 RepID=A0ABU7RMT3_9ACTN